MPAASAKWATPSAESSNLASTVLDGLANGNNSARIASSNASNLDLYCRVTVVLGSITPGTGGSITLRYLGYQASASASEDIVASGHQDSYTALLNSGTGVKRIIFEMVRLYPFDGGFFVTNNAGVSLASSGNAIYVQPYNESIG